MNGWEMPWNCEICNDAFKPGSGGGGCERCGQEIYKKHLGVVTTASDDLPDSDKIVCDACLTTGEQTNPVKRKHYLRWFKKTVPGNLKTHRHSFLRKPYSFNSARDRMTSGYHSRGRTQILR